MLNANCAEIKYKKLRSFNVRDVARPQVNKVEFVCDHGRFAKCLVVPSINQ